MVPYFTQLYGLNSINNIKRNSVVYSTIQGFKGLESKVVVLIDIDQIQEKYFEKLLYTGISRAKVHLYIFCTSQIKKVLDERYLQGVKKWNKFIAAN